MRIPAVLAVLAFCGSIRAEILYIPQLVQGEKWSTTIRISNLINYSEQFEMRLNKADGGPWANAGGWWGNADSLGRVTRMLRPLDTKIFRLDQVKGEIQTGYAVMEINPEMFLVNAFQTFHETANRYSPIGRIGVQPIPSVKDCGLTVNYETGVSIINPTDNSIDIGIYSTSKIVYGNSEYWSGKMRIGPHKAASFFVIEALFGWDYADIVGHLALHSDSPFVAMGAVFQNGIMSSIPVTKIDPQAGIEKPGY